MMDEILKLILLFGLVILYYILKYFIDQFTSYLNENWKPSTPLSTNNQQDKSETSIRFFLKKIGFKYVKKEYYDNGCLKSVTFYRYGKKIGLRKEFYISGITSSTAYYANDKKHGLETIYSEDGSILRKTNFRNSEKDGLEIEYLNQKDLLSTCCDDALRNTLSAFKSNKFLKITTYTKGQKNGKETIKDNSNNIVIERQYKNGKTEGYEKIYYENGHLKSEIHYLNGKADGVGKQYKESGELLYENHFDSDGVIDKITVFESNGLIKEIQNGQHIVIMEYENGKPKNGIIKEYNNSNILIGEYSYKDGIKDGTARVYYNTGKLKWEGLYKDNDIITTYKRFDDLGCPIEEYDLYEYVVKDIQATQETSETYIQNKLMLTKEQTNNFIKMMENDGILSKPDKSGNRTLLKQHSDRRELYIDDENTAEDSKNISISDSPKHKRIINL